MSLAKYVLLPSDLRSGRSTSSPNCVARNRVCGRGSQSSGSLPFGGSSTPSSISPRSATAASAPPPPPRPLALRTPEPLSPVTLGQCPPGRNQVLAGIKPLGDCPDRLAECL